MLSRLCQPPQAADPFPPLRQAKGRGECCTCPFPQTVANVALLRETQPPDSNAAVGAEGGWMWLGADST